MTLHLGVLSSQGLLTLVTCSKTSIVVAEAVVVLRQLLQKNSKFEGKEAVVRGLAALLLRSFSEDSLGEDGTRQGEHEQAPGGTGAAGAVKASLEQPAARASIIWTLSEYHEHISGIASDILRVLAKSFPELDVEVKMQVSHGRAIESRWLEVLNLPSHPLSRGHLAICIVACCTGKEDASTRVTFARGPRAFLTRCSTLASSWLYETQMRNWCNQWRPTCSRWQGLIFLMIFEIGLVS